MMFNKGRPKMLFRRENTTARGAIRHGGEYRWERHKKQAIDENLPMREGMHGRIQQGIPNLFYTEQKPGGRAVRLRISVIQIFNLT
ncbi:hypothetical protein [Serratia liquefaciens]|uniref:hypothetical protein n=1 Tax=Serratia liquefaciens TaxID=614 RepID=UPI0007232963|nr:hypothetical protein [Serratia liquefaciens]GAK26771.1 hypothetical protein SLIQ_08845 [Serratia liquefaciens FK01]